MARFFIDRPVFAIVLAILITLLGTIAAFNLPIAQYPNITKPQITVSTNYVVRIRKRLSRQLPRL